MSQHYGVQDDAPPAPGSGDVLYEDTHEVALGPTTSGYYAHSVAGETASNRPWHYSI